MGSLLENMQPSVRFATGAIAILVAGVGFLWTKGDRAARGRKLRPLIIMTVLVLLIGGACNRPINQPRNPSEGETTFTPTPRGDGETSGSVIAFIGVDGNLWLLDLHTRRRQRLTTHGHADSPSWSPDGRMLAYIYEDPHSGIRYVHLYDILERVDRPVAGLQDPFLSDVTWSPDGRYLAGDIGCCPQGRIMRILDMRDERIVSKYEYSLGYAWSPDGTQLALGVEQPVEPPLPVGEGTSNSIIILKVGQNAFRKVIEGNREYLYWPVAWLPDGRLVYKRLCTHCAEEGASPELWEVKIEAGKIHKPQRAVDIPAMYDRQRVLSRLPPEMRGAQTGEFSWSPDGRWVVFHVNRSIYLLNWVEDGRHLYLTEGTKPAWRPHPEDGDQLRQR